MECTLHPIIHQSGDREGVGGGGDLDFPFRWDACFDPQGIVQGETPQPLSHLSPPIEVVCVPSHTFPALAEFLLCLSSYLASVYELCGIVTYPQHCSYPF